MRPNLDSPVCGGLGPVDIARGNKVETLCVGSRCINYPPALVGGELVAGSAKCV